MKSYTNSLEFDFENTSMGERQKFSSQELQEIAENLAVCSGWKLLDDHDKGLQLSRELSDIGSRLQKISAILACSAETLHDTIVEPRNLKSK